MSPDTARAAFVLELRNAHAMERQSLELMKWQAVRLGDYPEIERRIRTHMTETEEQLRKYQRAYYVNPKPAYDEYVQVRRCGRWRAENGRGWPCPQR